MRQHTALNHRKKDREMELIRSRNLPMEKHLQRSAITEQKQVMRNIRIFRQERDSSLRILQRLMQMNPVTGHPEPMQQERTWQWNFITIV